MPVQTTTIVDIREQIALMTLSGRYTVTEIADLFGVTRPTVYKYRDRYRAGGRADLIDRSRAPNTPLRTPPWMVDEIIRERTQYGWGSKKIRRRLIDAGPQIDWPARSTIDAILKREGLVKPRRRRPRYVTPFRCRYEASEPGQASTIDFKGEFRMRNRRWCYPLTMADVVSRYLLACEALPSTELTGAWPVVERVFREHGLPLAMISDNGPPFGAHGVGRLSLFSVRLMELGIQPVFIDPGHPEQNGSHERMHRTLLERLGSDPAADFPAQQNLFRAFQFEYNEERPHEGIGLDRPAKRYRPSSRPYPATPPAIEYPDSFEVHRVLSNGAIKRSGQWIFISKTLIGRPIALEQIDYGCCNVHFGSFLIGRIDVQERRFV